MKKLRLETLEEDDEEVEVSNLISVKNKQKTPTGASGKKGAVLGIKNQGKKVDSFKDCLIPGQLGGSPPLIGRKIPTSPNHIISSLVKTPKGVGEGIGLYNKEITLYNQDNISKKAVTTKYKDVRDTLNIRKKSVGSRKDCEKQGNLVKHKNSKSKQPQFFRFDQKVIDQVFGKSSKQPYSCKNSTSTKGLEIKADHLGNHSKKIIFEPSLHQAKQATMLKFKQYSTPSNSVSQFKLSLLDASNKSGEKEHPIHRYSKSKASVAVDKKEYLRFGKNLTPSSGSESSGGQSGNQISPNTQFPLEGKDTYNLFRKKENLLECGNTSSKNIQLSNSNLFNLENFEITVLKKPSDNLAKKQEELQIERIQRDCQLKLANMKKVLSSKDNQVRELEQESAKLKNANEVLKERLAELSDKLLKETLEKEESLSSSVTNNHWKEDNIFTSYISKHEHITSNNKSNIVYNYTTNQNIYQGDRGNDEITSGTPYPRDGLSFTCPSAVTPSLGRNTSTGGMPIPLPTTKAADGKQHFNFDFSDNPIIFSKDSNQLRTASENELIQSSQSSSETSTIKNLITKKDKGRHIKIKMNVNKNKPLEMPSGPRSSLKTVTDKNSGKTPEKGTRIHEPKSFKKKFKTSPKNNIVSL